MSYDLIIAEKKTLAEDIARAYGNFKRKGNFIEAEDPQLGRAKIYWTFGHILEVDISKTMKAAGYPSVFPVFPQTLLLKPKKERASLFKMLEKEVRSGSWKRIISAGDPDREGELLVREVLRYLKVPSDRCYRLWFNSQEKEALRRGLLSLKPLSAYNHVYTAGLARQLGDFHFGINASTALHQRTGNRTLSVGRVQTPVLKLIVDRYIEVKNFVPEDYYRVWIVLNKEKTFKAFYQKKEKGLVKEEEARQVLSAVKGEQYAVCKSVVEKREKRKPPSLYILSRLIQDAGRYGFNAQKTMSIVQRLYEQYKAVSYPRTESPYLANADRPAVVKALKRLGYENFVSKIPSHIFNDRSVAEAGHHAIIPINRLPDSASREEKLVYELIVKRFLAQFYPPYEYLTTTAVFECGGYKFKAVGRVDINLGWKQVYKGTPLFDESKGENGRRKEKDENQNLPPLQKGESVPKAGQGSEKKQTTPPPLYTSSSLVGKMEKLGLGTEATRHRFEDVLLKRGYIVRREKNRLYPTDKGLSLIKMLSGAPFTSPEMTAEWENVLDRIFKKRELHLMKTFLQGVRNVTVDAVNFFKGLKESEAACLRKSPSDKMKAAVLALAKKEGKEVSEEQLNDWDFCSSFLKAREDLLKKPSEKQIAYARQLADKIGQEIPDSALSDRKELSKWIDRAQTVFNSQRPLSDKQVQIIQKYGDEKVKASLQKGSYGECRRWLDNFFSGNKGSKSSRKSRGGGKKKKSATNITNIKKCTHYPRP